MVPSDGNRLTPPDYVPGSRDERDPFPLYGGHFSEPFGAPTARIGNDPITNDPAESPEKEGAIYPNHDHNDFNDDLSEVDPVKYDISREMARELRRGADPVETYVKYVSIEAVRLGGMAKFGRENRHDVAQNVCLKFWKAPTFWMTKYPHPADFARAATKNKGKDFQKSERAQRGEGADLRKQGGTKRKVVGFHRPDGGAFEVADSSAPVEEIVLGKVAAGDILNHLDDIDAMIIELSVIDGVTDGEIANDMGYARETVNRRKKNAFGALRDELDEVPLDDPEP